MEIGGTKILVTGAGGYLGSVLVPMLLEKGYFVRAAGYIDENKSQFLNLLKTRLEIIDCDLTNQAILNELMQGVGMVVHLASIVGEKICQKEPQLAKSVNTDLVAQINLARNHLPMIFTSTTSVYGANSANICTEETQPKPELAYAISKYEGEKLAEAFGNCIILRPATIFGFAPAINYTMLVNDFVFQAVKQKKLEVYDDSLNRTFIHVKDLANAVLFFIENYKQFKNQIFNVGSDEMNYSKREIAEIIHSLIDFKLDFVAGGSKTDKRNFIVSYAKIKEAGFNTKISLYDGIKDLIKNLSI